MRIDVIHGTCDRPGGGGGASTYMIGEIDLRLLMLATPSLNLYPTWTPSNKAYRS